MLYQKKNNKEKNNLQFLQKSIAAPRAEFHVVEQAG